MQALVLSTAALKLNGGTLDLATDATITSYNTTVGGTTTIQSDKASSASPGITHTLGTLSIGANTLNIVAGPNVSGGTPAVAFGATTLTSTAAAVTILNPTTANLSLTTVTGPSVATAITDTLDLSGTSTTNTISSTISNGTTGTAVATVAIDKIAGSSSTWILNGTNTYTGTTNIRSGTLQAVDGVSLPAASFLNLDGGVLQGNGITSFTRGLAATGE